MPPAPAIEHVVAALPADAGLAVVRDGARTVVAVAPDAVVIGSGVDALRTLDRLATGWWAGWLAYDLGRAVERVSPRAVADVPSLAPHDLCLARFDARLVLDPDGSPHLEGSGPGRALLERALATARDIDVSAPEPPGPGLGPWESSLSRAEFADRVLAILALLEAGECYQVNLTRRLTCDRPADPVALWAALAAHNPAPHSALLRLGEIDVVSASPERFLGRRGDMVETRPIKGTAARAEALASSAKDRAENVMIVDLARNDLGRVCEPGSIHVPALCAPEAHPGLHHLVSTVRGALRADVGLGELVRATFPPASVTGAPKPRVLQAIEDLEPVRRGVYCGAIGWIDTERAAADLAVAIRTFTIAGGRTHLGVGAGIVADSDPAAEWAETELKAARLLAAASAGVERDAPALTGASR